jgi:preprotein translocase subunit SecY
MTSELARRIAFTLGALLVYRLGTTIPVPGIETSTRPFSIFALNVIPYLSVAILIQLVTMVSSRLNALVARGDSGRRIIARYTFGLTLLLTAFQAYGIASGLQQAVPNTLSITSPLFLLSTSATLLAGTIFLIWLSEQITARGIGNGLALILAVGILAELPNSVVSTFTLVRQGALSVQLMAWLALLGVALVGLVVFVELARRHVPIEFAARESRTRSIAPQQSSFSIKLNSAGLIPTVAAPWLIFLPLTFLGLAFGQASPWLTASFNQIGFGYPGHMIVSFAAIVVLAFIYTSFVVDPERAAASLQAYGGAIPGIAPGEATAEHLDRVVSRTAAIGAAYLAAVFLLPEALISWAKVPYYFGGAPVLIVVCTVLDVEAQVRGMSLTGRGGEYA